MDISFILYAVSVGLGIASFWNGRLLGLAVAALAGAVMMTGK
jgi:hypothetical protein